LPKGLGSTREGLQKEETGGGRARAAELADFWDLAPQGGGRFKKRGGRKGKQKAETLRRKSMRIEMGSLPPKGAREIKIYKFPITHNTTMIKR